MTIKKVCKTLSQAEKNQAALYNKYDSVKLVKSPLMFSQAGEYVWEVKQWNQNPRVIPLGSPLG